MGAISKKKRLQEILKGYPSLIIAFSGGVDSTYLLAEAHTVLGDGVVAVTAESELHPEHELRFCKEFTARSGIRHMVITTGVLQRKDFSANTKQRCYICKLHLIEQLQKIGEELGIGHIAHGANVDDLDDFRPGMKAAREKGLLAPLLEAGLSKADIRRYSRELNLPTWDKPSMACLASRIPYGSPVTRQALGMIERAEEILWRQGIRVFRVRHHGDIARIEVGPQEVQRLMAAPLKEMVLRELKQIGYRYVAVDLEGYVQGSLNRVVLK